MASCRSDSSSTSKTEMNTSGKADQTDEIQKDKKAVERPMFDLNLSTTKAVQELDLIGSMNSSVQPPQPVKPAEPRSFSCRHCDKKFQSSQALGGHQNAHKEERRRAKLHQPSSFGTNHQHQSIYHYPLPTYGALSRSLLGLQGHAMVQKPYGGFAPATAMSATASIENLYGLGGGHALFRTNVERWSSPGWVGAGACQVKDLNDLDLTLRL